MLAMIVYARDHDGRLPEADRLPEALLPRYHPYKFLFICPDARNTTQPSYAMVPIYSGAELSAIPEPESAIVLYEVADGAPVYRHGRPNPPVRGSVYALIREKLTKPGMNVGFADGHARWSNRITPEMLAQGRDFDVARKLARSRFRGR